MFANFNGHNLDDYLRITAKLQRNIGTKRNNKLVSMAGGRQRFAGRTLGENYIEMPFILRYDLIEKKRALADILDVEEPVKLWFEDEPDKYYLAIPDNEISIDEIVFLGKGVINFLIPDGVAHAIEPTIFPFVDNETTVINQGTYKTPVDIHVTFTSDADSIGFVSDDTIVQLGTTYSEDESNFVPSQKILNDGMGSSTGWSVNSGRPRWRYPDSGDNTTKIMGSVKWDAAASSVYPSSYDSVDASKPGYWHGPTISRSLTTMSDFDVYHRIEFKPQGTATQKPTCQGLMEINYMDADSNFVMGFEIKDNNNKADEVKYSFFIGDYRMFEGKLPKSVLTFHGGFFGSIQMTKIGNQFTFRLARIDGDTWKETWSVSKSWNNETVAMLSASSLQMFMSVWKNDRAMNQSITHTRITKLNTQDKKLIPLTFYNGDELFVEGETNRVYLNGLRADDYRVIGSSQVFMAEKGDTDVAVITDGTYEGYLEMRERYL